MASGIKKNFLYNAIYQIVNIILPLITVPIISRALGPENSGIYSYTYSIVGYFMIFGMLGISNYGSRMIAKSRDNPQKLTDSFLSLHRLQIITNIIVMIAYSVYVALFAEYRSISLIETVFIISNIFDISWLFFGLEEFKKPVVRNILIKAIAFLAIIIFVKQPADLPTYTLIMAASSLISQLTLWVGLKKYLNLKLKSLERNKILIHLRGVLILFIPVIAYSIYRMMDIIMLGIQTDMVEVGFYQYAEKIIGVPLGFITALGAVMLPRFSNMTTKNNKTDAIKKRINSSLVLTMFVAIPFAIGLFSVSSNLASLFLGAEYSRSGEILKLLSTTIIFSTWTTIIRTQWLIPNEKDGIYISTTIAGAVINFVINLMLIPILGGIGAAIGTVVSEATIAFSQSFLVRKDIAYSKIYKKIVRILTTSVIMLIIFILIDTANLVPLLSILCKIIIGPIIYLGMNISTLKEVLETLSIRRRNLPKI